MDKQCLDDPHVKANLLFQVRRFFSCIINSPFSHALPKCLSFLAVMVDPSFYVITCIRYNLVFQAHFSQLEMPVSDYVTDLKSVLDQSIRIIQAMIDISANSGWLSSARTCMHLLQMVMQVLLVIVFFHFSLARIESVTQ